MKDSFFSEQIISWYRLHQRDLPWRHTKDPYLIWLSEIILQQTRVKQGLPYFYRFAETFPTLQALAKASEQEVLRLWQGLGYYSRARNMHACARLLIDHYEGRFPEQYAELIKLKGVGAYTAAAIASFAFNETVAVLDGNVFRVLARVYGIDEDILSVTGQKTFRKLANALVPEGQASVYNQAIMEFGALQCTPQNPACLLCPLSGMCYAYQHGEQKDLPVKVKKVKVKRRFFSYIVLKTGRQLWMKERTGKDIWKGLYDFHLLETSGEVDDIFAFEDDLLGSLLRQQPPVNVEMSDVYRHQLTHQQLWVRFFSLDVSKSQLAASLLKKHRLQVYSVEDIKKLPKPILIENYLSEVIF